MRPKIKKGLRIVYFTLQFDHIHLYIEAQDVELLKAGMKAFTASVDYILQAKNKLKTGIKFFKDRYHMVIKKTPEEVKRMISYILFNTIKQTLDPPKFWLSLNC
jgi:hypothetical protein